MPKRTGAKSNVTANVTAGGGLVAGPSSGLKLVPTEHDCVSGHWGASANALIALLDQGYHSNNNKRGWALSLGHRSEWDTMMTLKQELEFAGRYQPYFPRRAFTNAGAIVVAGLGKAMVKTIKELQDDRLAVSHVGHDRNVHGWIATGRPEQGATQLLDKLYGRVAAALEV